MPIGDTGELTEPLMTDEECELRNLNDFDKWEEVTTDDTKEWRLKDQDDQQRYDELYKKDQDYTRQRPFCRNPSTS